MNISQLVKLSEAVDCIAEVLNELNRGSAQISIFDVTAGISRLLGPEEMDELLVFIGSNHE